MKIILSFERATILFNISNIPNLNFMARGKIRTNASKFYFHHKIIFTKYN